jgi:hypothetical protein
MPSAGAVKVTLSVDAANYSAGIDKAKQKVVELTNATTKAGHSTVSSMQASSAAIRTLEGNWDHNTRAVERFLTQIPGVGKALQLIFPLVGGLAFGAMVVDMGKKIYEFEQAGKNAGRTIQQAFQDISASTRKTGIDLDITNDKLQNQIAKLEHKPENLLRLALDEDRKAAFELTQQLEEANKKTADLFKKSGVNQLQALGYSLLGHNVASTGDVETLVNGQNSTRIRASIDAQDALDHASPADRATVEKANTAKMSAMFATQIQALKDQLRHVYADQAKYKGIDYSSLTASLEGSITELQGEQHNFVAGQQVSAGTAKVNSLQQNKQATEDAKRLATERVEAMRNELTAIKAQRALTLVEESDFWAARVVVEKKGSETYLKVIEEYNKDLAQIRSENAKGEAEFDKLSHGLEVQDLSKGDETRLKNQTKSAIDWVKAVNEGNLAERANSDAVAEASIKLGEATGTISKHDAAVQLAQLHTKAYNDELARMQAQLASIASDPTLTQIEKNARSTQIQNQIGALNTNGTIQSASDQNAVNSATTSGATRQAIDQMVNDWSDMTKNMSSVLVSSINSLNDSMARAMTGQKGGFAQAFQGISQNLMKTGLQSMEGGIMKKLGFGAKADGSAQNPFYVTLAGPGGAAGGVASGAGGIFSHLLGGLFQGAFASGGDVVAGRPALVGEHGPELFMPGSAGTIIPNHKLSSSGHTTHIAIDARGSTDPAQTEAAVHRAVRQYIPSIVATTRMAVAEDKRRSPSSRQ